MALKTDVETFRASLKALSEAAQKDLETVFKIAYAPGVSSLMVTDALHKYVPDIVQTYGEAAATVAGDYYAAAKDSAGLSVVEDVPLAEPAPLGQIHASTGWAASDLGKPGKDPAAVLGNLQKVVDRLVKKPARETLVSAIANDPLKPRFARIPTGPTTCLFCAMLASRGAVYVTEQTAGAFSDFHDHCDCAIAPIFPGAPLPEGYDPDHYLQAYAEHGAASIDLSDRTTRIETAVSRKQRDAIARAQAKAEAARLRDKLAKAHDEALAEHALREAKAEADRLDAERLAAERAAAEKKAALEAKWKGKPAPPAPEIPTAPQPGVAPRSAFASWEAEAKARYAALGTGKTLEQSYNWSYFEKVFHGGPGARDALDYLKANKYLDDAQFLHARKILLDHEVVSPEVQSAYEKALRSYKNRSTRHKRYLAEWREANGYEGGLQGMAGAHDWTGGFEDDAFLKKHFHDWTNDPARGHLNTYTGSSYRSWNDALRRHADADSLPSSYASETKALDAGFSRSRLAQDVYLRRGTNMDEFVFPGGVRSRSLPPPDPRSLVGTVQVQHGYMSTSYGKSSAFSGNVSMLVRVPTGHGAAWADPISQFRGEREVLLERGSRLFIHSVEDRNGVWHVQAEIIPDGVPSEGHAPMPLP